MFVRVKTTPNSPRRSVQVVQSWRIGTTVKQKIVRYMGIALDEAEEAKLRQMAQEFIEQGMPRAEAEAMPKAHAITKWLGSDAVEVIPRTGVLRPSGEGWLLVCSDGLWNYASEPVALAEQLVAAAAVDPSPLAIGRALVTWANAQGGQDNVTVALARYPVRLGAPAGSAGEGEPIDG